MQNAERVIRVAQVIGMAIDGGVEACIMNYYRHIDRTRVQFDFFVESTSKIIDKDEIEAMGGRVVIIPHYSHPFTYLRVLERLFREGHYDIVHSNMNTLSVFPLLAAKRAGIPVRILHNHSTWGRHEPLRNLMKFFLRPTAKWFATEYAACSLRAAEWMYGKRKVKRGKVTVINNAIDLDRFAFRPETRARIREENGWGEDFIVGHIGRFMKQKNHEFLVNIFAEVVKQEPRARLVLVGDGELRPKVVRQVEKLGLAERVSFVGTVANPEDYYQAFDAFAVPSRYEGLGLVCIEAQVTGLSCLFSDKITNEVLVTSNAKMLSLNSPYDWANEILAHRWDKHRTTMEIPPYFDLLHEANHLLLHYQSLLQQ